jgi:hypothetical protein
MFKRFGRLASFVSKAIPVGEPVFGDAVTML